MGPKVYSGILVLFGFRLDEKRHKNQGDIYVFFSHREASPSPIQQGSNEINGGAYFFKYIPSKSFVLIFNIYLSQIVNEVLKYQRLNVNARLYLMESKMYCILQLTA